MAPIIDQIGSQERSNEGERYNSDSQRINDYMNNTPEWRQVSMKLANSMPPVYDSKDNRSKVLTAYSNAKWDITKSTTDKLGSVMG